MDLSREDVRRQLDLEAESRSLGINRYERSRPMPWKAGAEARAAEEEANLPPGQHLLRMAVEPTAAAIRAFIEAATSGAAGRKHSALKWLELAQPEEVAYLTARVALNLSVQSGRNGIQRVTTRIATAIIDHVDMVSFHGANPGGYTGLIRKSRKVHKSTEDRMKAVRKLLGHEVDKAGGSWGMVAISRKERLLLGTKALELLIETTGLFTIDTVPKNGGRAYVVRPTEAVQQWLGQQHERSALLMPVLMPMVVRPRRWRNLFAGGYLRRLYGRPMISARSGPLETYQEADLSLVYEAVNHIQETPWRVNRKVLDVFRAVWDSGGTLGGLPPREDLPLPGKPEDFDADPEGTLAWKRDAAQVYEKNAQLLSKRFTAQQTLWMAERFADERAIWFPHALDFRGRVYPLPSAGLHPQADDLGKSLLEFAHGLPLGKDGAYWLAVHVANVFGVDKVSFAERVKWTYDNAAAIIDTALDPLDGERFWLQADSPWMALAACIEFAAFLEHGETHVSHLPVPLDGSNSGLQHFSALLRDPVGAAAVNLTPADKPSDVYDEVAVRAATKVRLDTTSAMALVWTDKITRKIAKRPTMTYVYSATRFGMQDMILQTLRELDEDGRPYLDGADNYEAAKYLSHVMFDAVREVVSAASEAMDWLRSVARIANDAGVWLKWSTPDRFPVQHNYRNSHGRRVEVHWMSQPVILTLAHDGTTLAPRAQSNAVAPNYVHSLDAAHLRALARAAKKEGIDHLGVVHDSFATHAANTDRLARLLRETFVEQYEPNLLEQFREDIAALLPEAWAAELPQPPRTGTLDLRDVLNSPYLFA